MTDEGMIIPDLADEWDYDSAGTEITFKLNPAARWHDGEPVTSDDVVFTFDTIMAENTKTDRRSDLQVGGETVTWSAPDAGTFVITTPQPFAPLLFALSNIGIIPQHILADVEDINTDPFNLSPIGSGPFKIVEWQQNIVTRYERFDDYFRGPAAADALNEVFFEDAAPALASLEAGEVDVVFAPPESQAPFEDNPDFLLLRYVYYTPITLSFNQKHPLLQDLKLRQAIELAVDKDSLAETLTKGRNSRADNQYADSGPLDRYNDYSLPKAEFDVEQANTLLDDAGYTLGTDGVREKDGQRLSFPMLTYSGFEEYKKRARNPAGDARRNRDRDLPRGDRLLRPFRALVRSRGRPADAANDAGGVSTPLRAGPGRLRRAALGQLPARRQQLQLRRRRSN